MPLMMNTASHEGLVRCSIMIVDSMMLAPTGTILKGCAIRVVTKNRRVGVFNCPFV